MERISPPHILLSSFWTNWRKGVVWAICIASIFLLGAIRAATDAELAFASFALLPVLVLAWVGGRSHGLLISFLAAAMWWIGDISAEREFSAPWIPWANALTRWLTYSLVAMLASQVRVQFEREYEHATHDILTGLQNRRIFLEVGNSEVQRAQRYPHPLAVLFLDLDDFKQLNDTKGHDAGDEALRATARALRGALRASDQVARLGGDEFAVLLPEIRYEAAVEAGRKISAAVNEALKEFPPVRASIGVAWFGKADRKFVDMVKSADELMYQVKSGGKGSMRAHCYTEENPSNPEG